MASQQNPCKLQLPRLCNCSLAVIFNVAIALVPRHSIFTVAEQWEVQIIRLLGFLELKFWNAFNWAQKVEISKIK